MKKIQYEKGEKLGSHGISYLRDATPQEIEATFGFLKRHRGRCAQLNCGHCGKDFIGIVPKVKNGMTKSCGCLKKAIKAKPDGAESEGYRTSPYRNRRGRLIVSLDGVQLTDRAASLRLGKGIHYVGNIRKGYLRNPCPFRLVILK